jgi:hypothetical protein
VKSIRKLAPKVALAASLGILGPLTVFQPASAALGSCTTGNACLWGSANFAGSATKYASTTGPISVNAQSRYNKTSKCATYYWTGGGIANGNPNTGWGSGQHTYTSIVLTPC